MTANTRFGTPLKRLPRTKARKPSSPFMSKISSISKKPILHIIPEEDEPRSSCSSSRAASPAFGKISPSPLFRSRSPSPLALTEKTKRRHVHLSGSDIRVARDGTEDVMDSSLQLLSTPPRCAPRPPQFFSETYLDESPLSSPSSSPDAFRLTFTDEEFKFPHPPLPTPSSPPSRSWMAQSPTPSMSTTSSSSPGSHTAGLPTTPSSSDDEFSLPPPRPLSIRNKRRSSYTHPISISSPSRPASPNFSTIDECEADSDSEWYKREFDQILTLCTPASSALSQARPESIASSGSSTTSIKAGFGFPAAQLDPSFPRRVPSGIVAKTHHRRSSSGTSSHRASPPPPVPPLPKQFRRNRPASLALRRPPPRSSVPVDLIDADDEDDCALGQFVDYYARERSDSLTPSNKSDVDVDLTPSPSSSSSGSEYSDEEEMPGEELSQFSFEFDMDMDLRLPLSLPTSPIDLEKGLEELRMREDAAAPTSLPAVAEEDEVEDFGMIPLQMQMEPGRMLKSKWSSSTLDQDERSPSGKSFASGLKSPVMASWLQFVGSRTKRGGSISSTQSPISPRSAFSNLPLSPTSPSPSPSKSRTSPAKRSPRRDSAVDVFGPVQSPSPSASSAASIRRREHNELRRRASTSSNSTSASGSSTGSDGLRRKPIPLRLLIQELEA